MTISNQPRVEAQGIVTAAAVVPQSSLVRAAGDICAQRWAPCRAPHQWWAHRLVQGIAEERIGASTCAFHLSIPFNRTIICLQICPQTFTKLQRATVQCLPRRTSGQNPAFFAENSVVLSLRNATTYNEIPSRQKHGGVTFNDDEGCSLTHSLVFIGFSHGQIGFDHDLPETRPDSISPNS